MSNIITLSGVSGYLDENGTAFLKLEDVARGLGFTRIAASGNAVVRWERVNSYLEDLGVSQLVGKDGVPTSGHDFIPENIFYRLAMKAKNETAERFQALVADEILPTIRKTGSYQVKPMTQAEIVAAQAQLMVEYEKRLDAVEGKAGKTESKLTAALDALTAFTPESWREEMNRIINGMCQENELNFMKFKRQLYDELERVAVCNLHMRRCRLRKRMEKNGATYREREAVSKLDIIERDPKLKQIFEDIVRRQQALYAKSA